VWATIYRALVPVLAASLTIIAQPARAQSVTSTMLVTATVVNFCTVSATPAASPAYGITTLCTPGVSATLSMVEGTGAGTSGTSTVSVNGGLIETVTTAYAAGRSNEPVVVTISF
jgi:hypothetical protein